MKTHVLAAVTAVTAVTLLAASPVHAVTLDSSGYDSKPDPPKPVVNCTLGDADIKVTSFADILGYQLKGTCTVTIPGSPKSTKTSTYEGGGSWNSATGQVNEWLRGKDPKGQTWEIQDGGNCKLDPWMTGKAGASCSAAQGSASPNAPANFVKKMGYPVTPDLLDGQARAILTGKTLLAMKAEHQAPVIVKPAGGGPHVTQLPLALQIDPGPGSPTKTFAVEWQAKVNGAWAAKNVLDQAGFNATVAAEKFQGLGEWRVRARAHQAPKASWSDWRGFTLPVLAEPPCGNASAWGATYDVAGMPSTVGIGTAGTAMIKVTNGSNAIWGAGTLYHLSYHWVQNGQTIVFDGERTFLPNAVLPCKAILLSAPIKGPPSAGAWTIQWDMVLEGVSWFSGKGVATGDKNVTASAAAPAPAKDYK